MEVKLILCNTQSLTNTANYIIKKYHSYVPTTNSVGRRIDWLVSCDGEIVGMIGIGSATYPPCKDVLNYLGITKSQYKDMFNQIGNNWRFCISGNIRNLGTMVLRQFRKQAKDIWKKYYGDELKYIVTFVGEGHSGSVYKADNWKEIGYTAGLPEHKSVSMKWDTSSDIQDKFVKPTGENRKIIFIKRI